MGGKQLAGRMRVRKTPEQDLDETRAELADAMEKAARWNARVEELTEAVTGKENMLILCAVRSVAASPEELRRMLDMIRGANPLPASVEAAAQEATEDTEETDAEENTGAMEQEASFTEKIQADTEPPLEQEE